MKCLCPFAKRFLEAALQDKMEDYLDEEQRFKGN
jgi:hypothetical protein